MFHQQIKKMHAEVTKEFKDITPNVGVIEEERFNKLTFIRLMEQDVLIHFRNAFITNTEQHLVNVFFESIVGQAYQYGSCAVQASTVYTRLLKQQQITENVEQIEVSGESLHQKVGYCVRKPNGKLARHYIQAHNVVVWGHASKQKIFELSEFSTLKGLSDTWVDGPFLEYNEFRKPTITDITRGDFVPSKIRSISCMDRNLTQAEWNNIAITLMGFQEYISTNYPLLCKNHNHKPAESELSRLEAAFYQEIQELKKLGNPSRPILTLVEEKAVKPADKTSHTIAHDSPMLSPSTKMKNKLDPYRLDVKTGKFFEAFDAGHHNKALRILCNAGTQQALDLVQILVEYQAILKLDPNEKPEGTTSCAFDYARDKDEFNKKLLTIAPDLHKTETQKMGVNKLAHS